MNYRSKLESQLFDSQNIRVEIGKVMVSTDALHRLLEDYDRIDSRLRVLDGQKNIGAKDPMHLFYDTIQMVVNHFSIEDIVLRFAEFITPMVKKKKEQKEIIDRCNFRHEFIKGIFDCEPEDEENL